MKNALDLFKLLSEKGFIKALASFCFASIVFCITPNDFFMVIKLTNIGYFAFLVLSLFLLAEIIHIIIKPLSKLGKIFLNAFLYAIKQERKSKKLWEFFDKADEDECEIVIKLLETENEPLSSMFEMRFTPYISDWIEGKCDYSTHFYYYWLNDEVYQLLKSSLDSYIKKTRKNQQTRWKNDYNRKTL